MPFDAGVETCQIVSVHHVASPLCQVWTHPLRGGAEPSSGIRLPSEFDINESPVPPRAARVSIIEMQRDTRYADAKVIETQIAEGRARNAQAHRLAMLDAAWRASLTRVATSHICVGTIPGAPRPAPKHVWRRAPWPRSSKMKIRAGVFARAVHQFCRCNPYPEHQDDAAGWIQGWWREYDLGASA